MASFPQNSRTLPPTLSSLPRELITRIAQLLDLPSALSLQLVCRAFASPAATRVWRDVDLAVKPRPGEPKNYPSAGPARRDAEEARVAALRMKIKGVLGGGQQRWALIQELRLAPRAGTAAGLTQVLDAAAASLRRLDISAVNPFGDPLKLHLTLDVQLLIHRIHFPFLTHVRMGNDSLHYGGLIPLLANSAPRLEELDIDLPSSSLEPTGWVGDPLPDFPSYEQPTAIRRLRVSFENREEGDHEDTEAASPILRLIRNCPMLRQLIIVNRNSYYQGCDKLYPVLVRMIGELSTLDDLSWVADMGVIDPDPAGLPGREPMPVAFPSLRRLLLAFCSWSDVFTSIPMLPHLETLYLNTDDEVYHQPEGSALFPNPSSHLQMIPSFARRVRNCPQLQTIRTRSQESPDDLTLFSQLHGEEELNNGVIGRIRSIRHAGSELLHVRLISVMTEVRDVAALPFPTDLYHPFLSYTSTVGGGSERLKEFEFGEEAFWRDYTDWKGVAVPLEVWERMRKVEGALSKAWEGRGIEVKEETWKVLTDWKKGLDAAAQA